MVKTQSEKVGLKVKIDHLNNPRVEAEQHYYNPTHKKLIELGLQPRLLSDELLQSMFKRVREHAPRIKRDIILPRVTWEGSKRTGNRE
jgi:UDP-sulfoquinovose synthase